MNAFLTPDGVPFYAGTYFPPRAAPGDAELAAGAGRASREAWREQRERDRRAGRPPILPRLRGAAALQAPEDELDPAALDAAVADAAPRLRPEHGGFCARRRSSRRVGDRVPAARRGPSADDGPAHAARDGVAAACTTRSAAASRATRSTRAGSCRTSRRCSTTTRCSRARTCTRWQVTGEPFFRRVCEETLDFVLRELRQDGGRLRLGAGRRLRGRRGQVLRVDAGRGARGARASWPTCAIEHFGMTEAGQLRGREHPGARDARSRGAARDQAPAATARASSACGPGSTTSA